MATGEKVEGRKSHVEARPNPVTQAKRLARRKPKGGRLSLRAISAELAVRWRPFGKQRPPLALRKAQRSASSTARALAVMTQYALPFSVLRLQAARPVQDLDLGVAEGARAAEAKHLLPLGGSTTVAGGLRSDLSLPKRACQPTRLYGLSGPRWRRRRSATMPLSKRSARTKRLAGAGWIGLCPGVVRFPRRN
jgi:hypothetical protein